MPTNPPPTEHSNWEQLSKQNLPIIEIKATGPAQGRTQLLYHIAASLLLENTVIYDRNEDHNETQERREQTDIPIGKHGGHVVWLDCSSRFDIAHLYDMMLSKAIGQSPQEFSEIDRGDKVSVIRSALDNLHLFQPGTSKQLLDTLRQLEAYIFGLKDQVAGALAVRIVVVSDLTSLYWEDKQREEEDKMRLQPGSRAEASAALLEDNSMAYAHQQERSESKRLIPFTLLSHHSSLASSVSRLSARFSCPILVSTISSHPIALAQTVYNQPPPTPRQTLRSSLPSPWARIVNVEIVMQKGQKRRKFQKGMTVHEALQLERPQGIGFGSVDHAMLRGWIDARKWIYMKFAAPVGDDQLGQLGMANFAMKVGHQGLLMDMQTWED